MPAAKHESLSAGEYISSFHKKMTGLFRQFETVDLRAPEMKEGLSREIFMELEIYARIEREKLYPLLESASGRRILLDSDATLREVEKVLAQLRMMNVQDSEFNRVFDGFVEDFEYHLRKREEELRILELARKDLLGDFGTYMRQHWDKLIAKPKYEDARPDHVQNVRGGEQKRKRA